MEFEFSAFTQNIRANNAKVSINIQKLNYVEANPIEFAFELVGGVTALVGMAMSFACWDKIKEKCQKGKELIKEKKEMNEAILAEGSAIQQAKKKGAVVEQGTYV